MSRSDKRQQMTRLLRQYLGRLVDDGMITLSRVEAEELVLALTPEERNPREWTAARQVWLEHLERNGPSQRRGYSAACTDSVQRGWCDWVRGPDGFVVYGDHRYELTEAGRQILASWRAQETTTCGVDKETLPL